MAENWSARRERGTRFGVRLLVTIARFLGRPVARLILHPVVGYFLLTAPAVRRASRDYLRRALPHRPRGRDVYRQMYCFAAATLDRVYMFDDASTALQISKHNYRVIEDFRADGRGAILLVAHLGSFELLRSVGDGSAGIRLRVLMDQASGAKANAAFNTRRPELYDNVMDTSESDVDRVLKVKAALDRGELVGLMADRCQPGERTANCDFLGDPAPFPLSPWLLAGLTKAPVILAFGLYQGKNRYEMHFEHFSDQLKLARAQRATQAQAYAQAYAQRLEHYVRKAPYNWFNFFDFWHQ